MPPDDGEGRLTAPEEVSSEALYEEYREPVYRLLRRRGCSHEEAEDLGQRVFLHAHRSMAHTPVHEPRAWIMSIALNTWRSHLRGRRALGRSAPEVPLGTAIDEDPGAAALDVPSREADPETAALSRAELERVGAALSELPPQMRRCLVLQVYQELAVEEIARLLRISKETVKSHLHQARQRLRRTLAEG